MSRKAPTLPPYKPGDKVFRPAAPPTPPKGRDNKCCCCGCGCGYQPEKPSGWVGQILPPPKNP